MTRVTWYGASAYARHYGKRLLTESEWAYAVSKHMISGKDVLRKSAGDPQINPNNTSPGSQNHTHMMDMGDDFQTRQKLNPSLLRLKKLRKNFKEWVIRNDPRQENIYADESKENIFYPSLVVTTSQYPVHSFKNFRYPWEAFSDVGFRCAARSGKRRLICLRFCLASVTYGPSINEDFCSRSRHAKKITAGI